MCTVVSYSNIISNYVDVQKIHNKLINIIWLESHFWLKKNK